MGRASSILVIARELCVDRVSLALGPCDSFTESSWSEVWTPAPEAAQNTEVGVQTERKETDRDRIEEAEEEDGEFEQVPRDVAKCLRVMNAAADTETSTKSLLDSEIISANNRNPTEGDSPLPRLDAPLGQAKY